MSIQKLLELLNRSTPVFIQTHNFPDPDAVAAAFGLHTLLASQGVFSRIVYDGEIRRASLSRMIEALNIPIKHRTEYSFSLCQKTIIVDGCSGNSNVTPLPGEVLGVIDHHVTCQPQNISFVDIRSNFGSCATLIFQYFCELGIPVPTETATALMIGINIDTAHLTRETTIHDIQAYACLFQYADMQLVNSIIRNNTQKSDLDYYRQAFSHMTLLDRTAFCYFPDGCDQNLLGILADFFLGIDEVDVAAIAARNGSRIDISLRSEHENVFCSDILCSVIGEYGSSGGHREMAGGTFHLDRYPEVNPAAEVFLQRRLREEINGAIAAPATFESSMTQIPHLQN
jgi:nanoRNase/pAp phosphatase (c-di-AMP/oligoRNAs hydrolase)